MARLKKNASPRASRSPSKSRRKSNQKKATPPVLAYDLGGTKVAVGVVNSRGKVLREIRVPVLFEMGKEAVLEQLAVLGRECLKEFPEVKNVGIASAGPLDPGRGLLLDPTNFARNGKRWGEVPIASILSKRLKRSVWLENDAASAMLAEHWVGAASGYDDAMILTLGTGLGTGVIANGELVRSGRMLHPEAGHIILRAGDETARCGCGNLGCAEALLSGNGFGKRAAARLGDASLSAVDVARMAREGNPQAKAAFKEYAYLMAAAMQTYVRLYAPEIIVLTGSFAQASDLFLEEARKNLEEFLCWGRKGIDMLPRVTLSTLENTAGLIGGARIAMIHS